jgi:hypothetical protein
MILTNCLPFCKILDVGSIFSSLLKFCRTCPFLLSPNVPLLSCSGIVTQIIACMEFCKQIHHWHWCNFYFPWWSCVLKEIKSFVETTKYEIHSKWVVINTLPQMNNEIKGKLVIPIFIYLYITFHFKQSSFIKFFHSPPCRLE